MNFCEKLLVLYSIWIAITSHKLHQPKLKWPYVHMKSILRVDKVDSCGWEPAYQRPQVKGARAVVVGYVASNVYSCTNHIRTMAFFVHFMHWLAS